MNPRAYSRILSHIILTVFFCALAVAAVSRPLARTALSLTPQLNQVHQGLERHTFFEVSAGSPHTQALYDLLIRNDLTLMAAAEMPRFRVVSARQSDNWPVVFLPAYRHIPPAKSGDSDVSA